MQTTEAELVQYNDLFKHTKKVRSLWNSEAGKGQNQGRHFKQVNKSNREQAKVVAVGLINRRKSKDCNA